MSNHDAGAEGVEHLQRAAREMVAAARSFLDAIEGVVEDRDALKEVSTTVAGLAATVGDVIGDAVRGGRPAPWVDSAWRVEDPAPAATDPDSDPAAARPVTDPVTEPVAGSWSEAVAESESEAVAESEAETVDDSGDETEEWAQPLVDPEQPRRPSRVRRISVD